ncbi:HET-domain-containing protein, partial [Ophiobolus disseminans]
MRLIHSDGYSGFSLSLFHGRQIPPYAILSHTWGADDDEVSFEDLSQYSGLHWAEKPGYKKLQFCARRAAAHGLQYFWVDTCCINKSSGPELSEAINSMYRWYQGAARCYVYLSDFEMRGSNLGSKDWKRLRNSRWFTRGWTLQELLAPQSADFYDATGKHLGDKNTLSRWLSDTTGIPVAVLRDRNWRHNSVEEILSWAQHRQTKREEDGAYSLLGIFDISMSLIYGEGRDKAYRRLFKKIE